MALGIEITRRELLRRYGWQVTRHKRRGRWRILRSDGTMFAEGYDLHAANPTFYEAIDRAVEVLAAKMQQVARQD